VNLYPTYTIVKDIRCSQVGNDHDTHQGYIDRRWVRWETRDGSL